MRSDGSKLANLCDDPGPGGPDWGGTGTDTGRGGAALMPAPPAGGGEAALMPAPPAGGGGAALMPAPPGKPPGGAPPPWLC